MTRPLHLVAVSGGLQRPSKASVLAQHMMDLIADQFACQSHLIELGALAPQLAGTVWRSQASAALEHDIAAVEQADVLVVVTPVFRGSYTGLFKHFFDFVDPAALIDKPVLLAATGGSDRHCLMIEHQMRPLFSFFQARTLPMGVYATDKEFVDYCLRDDALLERARLAVARAAPVIELTRDAFCSMPGQLMAT